MLIQLIRFESTKILIEKCKVSNLHATRHTAIGFSAVLRVQTQQKPDFLAMFTATRKSNFTVA